MLSKSALIFLGAFKKFTTKIYYVLNLNYPN